MSGSSKVSASLASYVYKMTALAIKDGRIQSEKTIIDTNHKNTMQEICIRGDWNELNSNKATIIEYCLDDVRYLKKAFELMRNDTRTEKILRPNPRTA